MRIPDATLDELRGSITLSKVIGRAVTLKKMGREHVGLCPFHNERSGSFTVNDGKGFFHCFGCGAHGDAVSFIMRHRSLSFPAAVAELAREVGMPVDTDLASSDPPAAAARRKRWEAERRLRERRQAIEEERTRAWAYRVWQNRASRQTLVETYLHNRYIDIARLQGGALPKSIGFHPALRHPASGKDWPAMLMAMQDRNGVFRALHRTWLQPDGCAKAPVAPGKMMAGRAWGAAAWLSPCCGTTAKHAYAGEGGETMLSVQMALCDGEERRELGFYAACSLGNLAGAGNLAAAARAPFHPDRLDAKGNRLRLPTEVPEMSRPGFLPPPGTRRITLCEDNDNKDQASAEALYRRAANRWAMMGLEVDRATPREGEDFNSMLAK